jgi:hypothetical protein
LNTSTLHFAGSNHTALRGELSGEPHSDPEAGAVIRGSGGVRKLRWGVAGRGKSGGIRVIYFLRTKQGQVWMLTLHAKNVAESISATVLKQIKDEIDG